MEKSKNKTSKSTIEAINQDKLTSEWEQYQQYLQNQIEMYRRELTDKNIVKLFTNPDTITDLLKKIKQQKKELIKPTKNKTKENAKTKYNQLSALEDKLQIINQLYIDENEVFDKINEIDDQLDEISNQNFAKPHKFDKNLISINEIKEQIDNLQQKENLQKEEKLNKQKQQFAQKIINRFNNILGKLPNINKIQSKFRQHLANKKINQLRNVAKTIQSKFRQYLAVKEYILDNLTFQHNQNNVDIQNIDNHIQVRISKQEIESKKQKISFLESIFCCCSRSTIAKQEHNQLIDRFLSNHQNQIDNEGKLLLSTEAIAEIQRIKDGIRRN